ncbi:MAG: hypothetical protein OXU20_05040 [Myxococcales bacterium]|nr:hypothetical protein [Myxococcales bacterium]MDD9964767.1 hypothetical protein [Myxococcales bacterium]
MTNGSRWSLALALFGCAEGAGGMPQMGSMPQEAVAPSSAAGAAAPATAATAVSFEAAVMPIIDETCNCHQTAPVLMAPFSLKAGEAYDNLVGAPSQQQPAMQLVVPGSLNQSYLWHKLQGTQLEVMGSGEQMPSTFPLDEAQLNVFGRWIADNAPR